MPHLTLEYTRNLTGLDPALGLQRLNEAMLASGLFNDADIKSRAIPLEQWQIGTGNDQQTQAFAHVKIALLAGRSAETRRTLADAVLTALQSCCQASAGTLVQCCVETQEIDVASYAKASFIAT